MINVYTLSHRSENPSYILTKVWLKKGSSGNEQDQNRTSYKALGRNNLTQQEQPREPLC